MTTDEATARRQKLEREIGAMLDVFERETGVEVVGIGTYQSRTEREDGSMIRWSHNVTITARI